MNEWGPVAEPGSVPLRDLPEAEDHCDVDDGSARRIRLTPASAIRMRPVHWTWQDRIPAGAITVIPGREGIGKSLTLAYLAGQITRGTLPGRHFGTPRPVIYAATEDSWAHTIAPRLYAAGADLDMVFRVDVEQDEQFAQLTLPEDCSALSKEIRRLGVALLAADPLLSLIHSGIDTHRDRELRTALEPLARLADETTCAVVGLAHFNKSASSDALNLITGSRAFSAVARAVVAIARDPEADDGSCVMSQAKNNLGRLDLPSLRYVIDSAEVPTDEGPAFVGVLRITGESDRGVSDILSDGAGSGEDRSERDNAVEWLRDYIQEHGGEAQAGDILKAGEAVGFAKRTLQRARQKAGVIARKAGFAGGWVWALTPEGDTEGAEDASSRDVAPTASSVSPSAPHLRSVAPPVGPTCRGCGGPNTNRYGANGSPYCLLCPQPERSA